MSTTTVDPTAAGPDEFGDRPARARRPVNPVVAVLKPLASLQLTVALMALSVGLVFLGTLAQKTAGIWTVVDKYFWSWVVMVDAQPLLEFGKIFFGLPKDLQAHSWARFPFPGGKLLGGLMFLNLLAAHALRLKLTWKRAGVVMLHAGLVLLFVGEFVTREFQVEQQMHIPEGGFADYASDTRNHELAFVDPSDKEVDRVTVVPAARLRAVAGTGQPVAHPDLPVEVEVLRYHPNSDVVTLGNPKAPAGDNPATAGVGTTAVAVELPEVSGVDTSNKTDFPSAYVRLFKPGAADPVGTYLVSLLVDRPQKVEVDGKAYFLALRNTRLYKPFKLHLKDFRFDRFVGTETAKNYSSELRLEDPERGQDREVTIRMNEPLRHRGETFYQSSFTRDEKTTILQVVRNPGAELPYLACALVSIGMLWHFGANLGQFLARGRKPAAAASPAAPAERLTLLERLVPGIAVGLAALFVLAAAMPRHTPGKLDLSEVARLPVVDGGRVKPLDTVARVDLRVITHREQFTDTAGATQPAIKWLLDAASGSPTDPGPAAKYKIFRVENDQVLDLLKLPRREGLRYSVEEMRGRFGEFDEAARTARKRQDKGLDLYEAKVLELRKHIETYLEVWQGHAPMLLPPGAGGLDWRTPAAAREAGADAARAAVRAKLAAQGFPADLNQLNESQKGQLIELFEAAVAEETAKDPALAAWDRVLAAYRANDKGKFDAAVTALKAEVGKGVPAGDLARARFEAFLNESALYYQADVMYLLAVLMCVAGWLGLFLGAGVGNTIRRATFWWLAATFAVHTFTLFSRMYLMDRPLVFVTNLYSSAVFIGWAGTAVCLVVERLYPIGVGNLVAAVLGAATTFVAHFLATSGDTLEMMQAVLDTNFWLATHVTTVTFGYAATYIAGLMALVYVVLWALPPEVGLKRPVTVGRGPAGKPVELGRVVGQIVYGIVCFATLLSFVGTVLGGIWADQSWGRFWGWDPKENGAVLIVLWNALILHARWCGLVKDRGVAVLALVGNMITTWSWFGTNQLGVGLHAYGFSNKLAAGCTYTWVAHLVPIAVGLVPWPAVWASRAPAPAKG